MALHDNFADAGEISGAAGTSAGNNIGATAEVGEPQPEGLKTVWYKWAAPIYPDGYNRVEYFSTRYVPGSTENPARPLRTILRIFSGTTLGGLTEVTYFPPSPPSVTQHKHWAHWERGSQVQFRPTQGTDYYIRVDGDGGNEGLFLLSWGWYRNPILNACDQRRLNLGQGEICMAKLLLGDVTDNNFTQDFGTFPAGSYLIRYVRGAWVSNETTREWAGVPIPTGVGGHVIGVTHQQAGGGTSFRNLNRPPVQMPLSYVEQEFVNLCIATPVTQGENGLITLEFLDDPLNNKNSQDVDPTYHNPIFALYKVLPIFEQAGATCVRPNLAVNAWEIRFGLKNLTNMPWGFNLGGFVMTVDLQETGGIVSPTNPTTDPPSGFPVAFNLQPLETILLGSTNALDPLVPFGPFTCTIPGDDNTSAIATLRFSNGVDTFPDLTWDLTPVIAAEFIEVQPYTGCGGAAEFAGYVNIRITNTGFAHTLALTAFVTAVTGLSQVMNGSCFVTDEFLIGVVNQNGGVAVLSVYFKRTSEGAPATISVHIMDGPVDHGVHEFSF